ncbi:hypothetical protein IGI04_019437 [Brassica rapa subsp. trilocularis]|uniref:Uncharacterized protein n=1 Tax=Brassica rapa subsp. trilocularis TaxID=1813537 RepID=A0ABQ7MFU6_BRACM|nr:hypothetical protein IGI04_019437 [Brassica rapa subsp. trilocularis]
MGRVSELSPRTNVAICVLMDSHERHVCADGQPHTATDVLCVLADTHRRPMCTEQTADVGQNPSRGLFGTSVAVFGCPSAHIGRPWLSVCVCVCPSAHKGRPWFSISTNIRTLVLGLSTLTLPVGCSGDFLQRGLSFQYTQDVCGCPPAHTGRLWVSASTHKPSVAVHVCPFVSVSTHRTSVAVHQHTHDVRGCPCVSVSTRLRLSVCVRQKIHDVRGCPCVSVTTHRTSVAVRQQTQDVRGSRWPFRWTVRVILAHVGCLFNTHRTSVGVCQHTDVCVCPSAHTRLPWLSVCVRVCPSAHTGRPWLSISTHISTLVLGLSTLALPVDCLGDFGPRGLSVQYTQDVRGCPPAHTGRPLLSVCVRLCLSAHTGRMWLFVNTYRTSVAVRGCPSAHVCGCPCVSVSIYRMSVVVCVCLSAHIGRLWLSVSTDRTSVAVRVCLCVSVSTHRTYVAVHQYTYQHVGPWTQHADPFPWTVRVILAHVDCLFSTQRTSVGVCQHTQDVYCCLSAHTGRLWLSMCVRQHTSAAVSVCLGVSVSTHRTSVVVRVCPSTHTGRLWLSISTHIRTLVLGLSTLALPVDCLGDFRPRGLSVQYTQDVRWCLPVHTGRPWLSVAVRQHTQDVRGCLCVSVSTPRTSVDVHQYTYQHAGPWTQHAGPSRGLFGTSVAVLGCPSAHTGRLWLSVCVRVCPSAHKGRLWLSISTNISMLVLGLSTLTLPVDCSGDFLQRGLSVQYTDDVCGCRPAHKGRPWLSTCVRLCPSAHTGRPWLSVSKHMTSVAVRVCPSAHVRGCPCVSISTYRTSVVVRVCLLAHTGRLWLSVRTHRTSVAVRVYPCVSVSTHRTSVAVHQYTYQHVGPWTQHADPSRGLFGCFWPMWAVCSVHTGRPWVSVSTHRTSVGVCQHTHDVCGCQCVSVCVRQYTQDVRGCPCVSVSTHRTFVAVRQHTQDVRGCPCVSVAVRQHIQDFCGCPCVSVSTRLRLSVCVRQQTSAAVRVCPSAHTGCPLLSVCVCLHTQDVCGCPSAHTGRPWLSVCVCVCPSAHTRRLWLSISTHISTLVLGLSTLTLPVDCSGDFGPRGLSVQYTQDVRGCLPAHTRRLWLSVSTHRTSVAVRVCPSAHVRGCPCVYGCVRKHTQDVCGCPCVSVNTHRTSVAVHQYTYQHAGPWTQDAGPSHGLTSVAVRKQTQDVRGCLCVSVGTPTTSVAVHQYTYQHAGPWTQHAGPSHGLFGTQRTSVAVHQYKYQYVGPWTQHPDPFRGLFE